MHLPSLLGYIEVVVALAVTALPLIGFAHEMGHAFWGLFWTDKEVKLQVRSVVNFGARKVGRLIVWGTRSEPSAVRINTESLTPRRRLVIAVSGPAAALLLTGLCTAAAVMVRTKLPGVALYASVVGLLALASAFTDLFPSRDGNTASDGWVIKDVLTGGDGRAATTYAREIEVLERRRAARSSNASRSIRGPGA